MDDLAVADYTAFVEAQWSPLFRTAYLLTGDYQLAEDLLQTTFTKVLLSWPRISRLGQPGAYARRMMTNQATSWWRRRSSSELPATEFPDRGTPGHEDSVTQSVVMWKALATLAPRQRAVVVLRYYEDLSEAEIAETLGIATGTVKSHCSAALSRLTIEIEKQDHDLLMNGGPA